MESEPRGPKRRPLPETVYTPLDKTSVLFHDWYADHFDLQPRRLDQFPKVSGLLRVENDFQREQVIRKMSMDELLERIKSGSMKGLPPDTKGFRLLVNECAENPLPDHFASRCIV